MPEQSEQYLHLMNLNFQFFALFVGLCIGSFLNVVIFRIPAELSVVKPRSRCPKCEKSIAWYDNIPVVSWVLLLGRCRNCKTPISPRYPMVELITGLLTLALFRQYGPTVFTVGATLYVALLIAIAYIDLDTWSIYDFMVLWGTVIGVLMAFFNPDPDFRWYDSLIGAGAGFSLFAIISVVFSRVFQKPALAKGDWYLLAMIGAFHGWQGLLPVILVSSLIGSVVGLTLKALGRLEFGSQPATAEVAAVASTSGSEGSVPETGAEEPKAERRLEDYPDEDDENWEPPPGAIPFGPFLALGSLAQLFMGEWMLDKYLGLLRAIGGA